MTEAKPSHPGSTEVWITGIGLATSLGEGLDANWEALNARRINIDEKGFAPYIVHPLAPVNFDTQIPKIGSERQLRSRFPQREVDERSASDAVPGAAF